MKKPYRYIINARDISVILGISPHMDRTTLLFEKLGYKQNNIINSDIERGIKYEPIALGLFSSENNVTIIKPGFKRDPYTYYIGGTIDGMYIENFTNEKIIIEIKCPKFFSKRVPKHCFSQIQTYLHIHDINRAKYVEYIPNIGLNIIDVYRNHKWWNNIFKKVRTFYEEILYWDVLGITNHPLFTKFVVLNTKKYIVSNMPGKGVDYSKFDKISYEDDEDKPCTTPNPISKDQIKMLLDNLKCSIGEPLTEDEFRKEIAKDKNVSVIKK